MLFAYPWLSSFLWRNLRETLNKWIGRPQGLKCLRENCAAAPRLGEISHLTQDSAALRPGLMAQPPLRGSIFVLPAPLPQGKSSSHADTKARTDFAELPARLKCLRENYAAAAAALTSPTCTQGLRECVRTHLCSKDK